MSFTLRPLDAKRFVVYDLLKRTRTYHAPIGVMGDWDVTDTLARIEALRASGVRVNTAGFLLKAVATVVAREPLLRTRMFHGLRGPFAAEFHETSCNLVVHREGPDGGFIFSTVVRHCDQKSVLELSEEIRLLKTTPLEELPDVQQLARIERIPRPLMLLHDYKVRSDPAYYIQRFGSFGMSAVIHRGSGLTSMFAPSPAATFYPLRIDLRPAVVDGAVVPREMLAFGLIVDHQVMDGMHLAAVGMPLKPLVEDPSHLLGGL